MTKLPDCLLVALERKSCDNQIARPNVCGRVNVKKPKNVRFTHARCGRDGSCHIFSIRESERATEGICGQDDMSSLVSSLEVVVVKDDF